jgi:hypothetical protein
MTKPNWNRLAALEFAGRLLTGRSEIHAGEAQAHADWALQWLGGDLPNSERPPGGRIEPRPLREDEQLARFDPPESDEEPLPMPRIDPAVWRTDHTTDEVTQAAVRGIATARQRFLHRNGNPCDSAPENVVPRNVPTEGDGSMTVPVYRFYEQPVDLVSGPVKPIYWREDTRNEVNRWSMWSDDQRWPSTKVIDGPRPGTLIRIRLGELPDGIPAETRYDVEE